MHGTRDAETGQRGYLVENERSCWNAIFNLEWGYRSSAIYKCVVSLLYLKVTKVEACSWIVFRVLLTVKYHFGNWKRNRSNAISYKILHSLGT